MEGSRPGPSRLTMFRSLESPLIKGLSCQRAVVFKGLREGADRERGNDPLLLRGSHWSARGASRLRPLLWGSEGSQGLENPRRRTFPPRGREG